jgi:choice-of-anchor A domain-containing protein
VATSFNAFIFGNAVSGGGHADGAVAVGGDWTGTGFTTTAHSIYGTVEGYDKVGGYVGGIVNFKDDSFVNGGANFYVNKNVKIGNAGSNTLTMNGGGTAYYGGTFQGNIGGGGSKSHQDLVDSTVFTDQKSYSIAQSAFLSGLTNSTINTSTQNWKLNVGSGLFAYNLTGSQISQWSTLDISGIKSDTTILFNVTGDVSSYRVSLNAGGLYDHILWNFVDADTINIDGSQFCGSILAPYATVNQSLNINGTIIANGWANKNGAEIHSYNFMGNLPSEAPSVPGPAAALSFGIAAVTGLMRRRKKA